MQVTNESDEETWKNDSPESQDLIINEIEREYEDSLRQVEEYKKSKLKDTDFIINPAIKYLNEEIFVILLDILEKTLSKAVETKSLKYHRTPFNPMDFIAEQLWNLNPNHPERHENWMNIFDMDWVKEYLRQKPRPYFPFSWIWSKECATLKIQSYVRGYWVRRREDVQEMRQFWKALLEDKKIAKELEDLKPRECECHIKEESCSPKELI